MEKKKSSRVHYSEDDEGGGNPSICDRKSVFTTKKEKKIICKSCLGLLIGVSKGDRKRRLQRQLKSL